MDFFHKAIKKIREHGFKKMIIVGGPHPTTSSQEVLEDKNIDLCIIGEGEATLAEIIKKLISNGKKRLKYEDIVNINGIAFSKDNPYYNRKTRGSSSVVERNVDKVLSL